MIDNPVQVVGLMDRMEAHLPIPAFPTKELVHALRNKGTKMKPDRVLFIRRVFYLGDEGGIMCDVSPSPDSKEKTVVSITHLRIRSSHPLSREIRSYQAERVRRIAAGW